MMETWKTMVVERQVAEGDVVELEEVIWRVAIHTTECIRYFESTGGHGTHLSINECVDNIC